MIVRNGRGKTHEGPGVEIELTGNEVATAIDAYLVAHGVHIAGPRTVRVNGELCDGGEVYVDPSGFAIFEGERYPRQPEQQRRDEARAHELLAELAAVRARLGATK